MLVIGTTNPGKIREIGAICHPLGVEIGTLELDVEETGITFAENALIKARAYSAARPGEVVLVEDSGLSIAKLGGFPGPWSARFHDLDLETRVVTPSGLSREEIDRFNNARVLELLRNIPISDRGATFVVHFVAMRDGEVLFQASGESHGWIAEEPRGTDGFGYDPIFIGADTFGRTYAEIDPTRKNLRSHRKDALRQLSIWIMGVVAQGGSL
jgi:XTP/dITP diphosphohydrolase